MTALKAEKEICHLPITVLECDKSAVQVVNDSGMQFENLNSKSISDILLTKPSLVENWLRYSQNKRSAQGWYFQRDQEIYIVGFHPRGEKKIFEYAIEACADFIIKEVSSIQQTKSGKGPSSH
jgi:hypothetical protein